MAITKVTKGVLGDGAIDNSKIAANTITTNQLHSTFTLDGVTEGASELYFTTARANSAIDSRVTKAFVDALNVDADTLDGIDILNIARTDIAETFSANVSGPTQANTNNSTLLATTAFVNNSIVIDRNVPLNHSSNGRHVNVTVTAAGGAYFIDGTSRAHVSLQPGFTYRFDQSDSSNVSHLLRFSTTSNGTHSGGSAYTTGVTEVGSVGSAGAYTQIIVQMDTPSLYYYCINHNAMGASVSIGGHSNTDALSEGTTNLYFTNARADARIALQVGGNLDLSSKSTSNLSEGTNLYFTNARAISAVTGSDLDMGGRKVLFGNLYSAEGDLPSASTYHGMFAHVHGTGKGYFAHAGGWKKLLDESGSSTSNLSEGTNLYYTVARANTAIDARVTQSMVSSLGFAPLASPTLTGTPTAPTAANTVNNTQIASTAFVTNKITNLIGGAPGTLDTLNELAAAINDDSNYNSTLTTAIATKAPLASPTFTGDIIIDSASAELNLKSGVGTDSGAINWTFNTTGTNYASVKLPYDTRATKGLWIDSGYPITVDATTRIDFDIAGSTKADIDTNGLTVINDITGANLRGNVNVRAGNTHMNNNGSIWREGFGGVHLTTNALYPGSNSGGVVNGSTSLGAAGYRFNTLFSSGVNNSGTISTQDLTVSGNLTVTGTTTQSTQTSSTTSANTMILLSSVTGSPSSNASFQVERGSSTNAVSLWDETNDRFNWNFPGYFTGGVTSSSHVTAASYMHITATGGAQHLLMGNQDSAGVNKPGMITGVNGYLRFGHGNSWSGTGGTFTEVFNTGSNNLDITGGALKIGGQTVITTGKDLVIGTQINFNNATNSSFIGAASTANLRYAADGIHRFDTYNGGWGTRAQIGDNYVNLSSGVALQMNTTEAISTLGSIVARSNSTHYSSGQVGLMVKDTGSGRGTVRIRSNADNAAECFFDVNGAIRWDISARSSSDAYDLNFYSQGSTPSYTTVAGPALQLKQNGDVKVQTALYTGGTVRISSTGALTNVSGNISQFTNNSGYITTADGANAGLLDSLDSADFLRRGNYFTNIDGTPSGSNLVRFHNAAGQSMNTGTSYKSRLEVFQPNSGADAFMSFHVSGDYALYFGLDGATNDISVGGWSIGNSKYRIYHSGNIGSQTMAIGTIEATNRSTFKKGIDLDRDVSNASGISWYSTGHHTWQEYMSPVGTSGCGPNGNVTAPNAAHGVTSWALRSYIENVSGYGWAWDSGGSSSATGTVMMGLSSVSGNLSVAGTVTANSDKRIKKNIVTIDNALDKVLKLRGVTYQRTDVEDDKVLMGVVAQEVEEIIPEVVSLGDPDDPDSIKSVSYGNMVGVLIEAIKEQQLQIDELKKQIESK